MLEDKKPQLNAAVFFLSITANRSGLHDQPWLRETSAKTAQAEINTLLNLVDKLRLHILGMHRTSLTAVEAHSALFAELDTIGSDVLVDEFSFDGLDLFGLLGMLDRVGTLYRRAKVKGGGYPSKGPPRKNQARLIALNAAQDYRRLTGKEPTITTNPNTNERGGQFLKFLREVFEALDIDASADVQAVAAVRELKRRKIST